MFLPEGTRLQISSEHRKEGEGFRAQFPVSRQWCVKDLRRNVEMGALRRKAQWRRLDCCSLQSWIHWNLHWGYQGGSNNSSFLGWIWYKLVFNKKVPGGKNSILFHWLLQLPKCVFEPLVRHEAHTCLWNLILDNRPHLFAFSSFFINLLRFFFLKQNNPDNM